MARIKSIYNEISFCISFVRVCSLFAYANVVDVAIFRSGIFPFRASKYEKTQKSLAKRNIINISVLFSHNNTNRCAVEQ